MGNEQRTTQRLRGSKKTPRNGPREHHLGYVVVDVGDDGAIAIASPLVRVLKKTARRDLAIASDRWPGCKLAVVRVSGFRSGPRGAS